MQNNMATKQKSYDIMSTQDLCVLSTINVHGQPESALVGFSHNDDLELMIGMQRDSRKYANMQHDDRVSVVVYDGERVTVQYEGVAREIVDREELVRRQEAHFAKLPGARRFATKEGQVYFSIRPTWVRLTAYDGEVPTVEEIIR